MARQEHDREDLLAEATALVERASLRVDGFHDELIVGFRRDGSASFYLGADSMYQFTSDGALRRAMVAPLLYKAQQGQLVSLERHRTADAVELVRRELTAHETEVFLATMQSRLAALRSALESGKHHVTGQVPEGADVLGRIRAWLTRLASPIAIAASLRSR